MRDKLRRADKAQASVSWPPSARTNLQDAERRVVLAACALVDMPRVEVDATREMNEIRNAVDSLRMVRRPA